MNRLGIFAKYWKSGTVKTRLACSIGAEPASELYRMFVETLLRRFEAIADRRVLCYWPGHRRPEFAAIGGPAWQLDPQSDGDLGQRMSHFFSESLSAGYAETVLIGSDSPTLPADYLERAFRLLKTHSVVLGPTSDGGYYLVGVSGTVPPIFRGVAWSTGEVWRQTVELLRSAGVSYAALPPWYDVDQEEDLPRLREELMELCRASSTWHGLLQAVDNVLTR